MSCLPYSLYESDFLSPLEDICAQLQIDVTIISLLFIFQLENKVRDVCSTVCIDIPDYVHNKRFVYTFNIMTPYL